MIRLTSTSINVPEETKIGSVESFEMSIKFKQLQHGQPTIHIVGFLVKHHGHFTKYDRAVDGSDIGAAHLHESLEFMHMVGALVGILRVDGFDIISSEAHVHNHGVLGSDGLLVGIVTLHLQVDEGHLVLVLQKTKQDEGSGSIVSLCKKGESV